MKNIIYFLTALLLLVACSKTEDKEVANTTQTSTTQTDTTISSTQTSTTATETSTTTSTTETTTNTTQTGTMTSSTQTNTTNVDESSADPERDTFDSPSIISPYTLLIKCPKKIVRSKKGEEEYTVKYTINKDRLLTKVERSVNNEVKDIIIFSYDENNLLTQTKHTRNYSSNYIMRKFWHNSKQQIEKMEFYDTTPNKNRLTATLTFKYDMQGRLIQIKSRGEYKYTEDFIYETNNKVKQRFDPEDGNGVISDSYFILDNRGNIIKGNENENDTYSFDNKINYEKYKPFSFISEIFFAGFSIETGKNNLIQKSNNPFITIEYKGDYPTKKTYNKNTEYEYTESFFYGKHLGE